jgi:putative oxidoreductase
MLLDNRSVSHPALSYADGLAASTADIILLIARIMVGWIFLRSGYGKLFTIDAVAASLPPRGIPAFMAYISVPAEFFGGLFLVLGFATRYVVMVMVIFVLVATFSSHRYWEFTDAAQRRIQDGNFWKNISMLGGICLLFVTGAGRLSLDYLLRRRSSPSA